MAESKTWTGLAGIVVALLLLALSAGPAAAHDTTVTSSNPANGAVMTTAPAQVTAQFSEELDTKGSTMVVLDAAGKQVSEGNGKVDLNDADHKTMIAGLPAGLADGTYTVNWHALLTDGDATDGTFKFTVGSTAAAAPATAAAPVPSATTAPTIAATAAATTTAPVGVAATGTPAPKAAAASAAPAATATLAAPASLPVTGGGATVPGWLAGVVAFILALAATLLLSRRRA